MIKLIRTRSLDSVDEISKTLVQLLPRQLNRVIGPVIVPKHISLVHSPEKSPPTLLAHVIAAGAARKGGTCLYLDSGKNYKSCTLRAFCPRSTEQLMSRVFVHDVFSLHDLNMLLENALQMSNLAVIIVDSLNGTMNLSGAPFTKGMQRKLFRTLENLRALANKDNVHILLTDHSSKNWTIKNHRPIGGNVLVHNVDTMIRIDRLRDENDILRILVERTPITPSPGAVVVRLGPKGVSSIKSG